MYFYPTLEPHVCEFIVNNAPSSYVVVRTVAREVKNIATLVLREGRTNPRGSDKSNFGRQKGHDFDVVLEYFVSFLMSSVI